jgi:REP element-mobilizing transposase RayT
MARPLRLQYPGALYHVTARGNARQPIYTDARDRQQFLAVLAGVVERFAWQCYAYCLMDNHYHLLIETPRGNLSVGMRQLNGVYTQRFNRRQGRVGHVFQGRFKAIVVEREQYLLALCRYVVLNPVRAGVVKQPERYRWSSYRATAGLDLAPGWLNREWVLAQFSTRRAVAERQYQQFVHAKNAIASPWEQVRGQVVLGTEAFVEELQPLLTNTAASKEIPQTQRFLQRPPLEQLLSPRQWQTRVQRDQAMRMAHVEYGYSLSAIGRQLGLHYSTISKIVQRDSEMVSSSPAPDSP